MRNIYYPIHEFLQEETITLKIRTPIIHQQISRDEDEVLRKGIEGIKGLVKFIAHKT